MNPSVTSQTLNNGGRQEPARSKNGLDRLHVFGDSGRAEVLWFIEDDDGGAITALLPSDY